MIIVIKIDASQMMVMMLADVLAEDKESKNDDVGDEEKVLQPDDDVRTYDSK